jgi:hypothetical protein
MSLFGKLFAVSWKPEDYAACQTLSTLTGLTWTPHMYEAGDSGADRPKYMTDVNPAEARVLASALNAAIYGRSYFSQRTDGQVTRVFIDRPDFRSAVIKSGVSAENVQEAIQRVGGKRLATLAQYTP